MRRNRRPIGLVRRTHWFTSVCYHQVPKRPRERRQRRQRLVIRHLVARFVHSQKAEVAVLAHFAVFGAIRNERNVARRMEFRRVGVVDGERDGLTAKPIADVATFVVNYTNMELRSQYSYG